MFNIKGKYNDADVFTDNIDKPTISQILTLCNMEIYKDSKIRIMPDCHAGKGCTVGTTMTIHSAITPNLVGVDIGCLDCETEYLTPNGWRKMSDYNGTDEILQYDIYDNQASFVEPLAYIKKECNHFHWYKNSKGLDMMVSDEHRILVYKGFKKRGYTPYDMRYSELDECNLDKGYYNIKCAFDIEQEGINCKEDELRLAIAIAADGTIRDNGTIEFHFKRERKIERIKLILQNLNIKYKEYKNIDGTTSIIYNNEFGHKKDLNWVFRLNRAECKVVAFEALKWDGHEANGEGGKIGFFSSNNKEFADAIQFAFTVSGFRTGISITKYNNNWNDTYVVVPTHNEYIGIRTKSRYVESIDGYKYCFSVPSTYFVARRNGRIFITGNCGMLAVKLKEKKIDLPNFDSIVRKFIPSGGSVHDDPRESKTIDVEELRCINRKAKIRPLLAYQSVGTLGGGNHFIEIDRDSEDNLWLVIHTGSRHLGIEVCDFYQKAGYDYLKFEINKGNRKTKQAELIEKLKSEGRHKDINKEVNRFNKEYTEINPSIPFELAYVTGELFEDYLHDMKIVQEHARCNRAEIARILIKQAKLHEVDRFDTIHNYIDTDNMILRKGAISAKAGEKVLIPMNMRDGSLICIGKGNSDWNESAPHGAGRLYSRSDTKSKFSVTEYKNTMKQSGIFTTSVCAGTLDECPMAYKPAQEIIDNIGNTVDIIDIIKPIYNFKASSEE